MSVIFFLGGGGEEGVEKISIIFWLTGNLHYFWGGC